MKHVIPHFIFLMLFYAVQAQEQCTKPAFKVYGNDNADLSKGGKFQEIILVALVKRQECIMVRSYKIKEIRISLLRKDHEIAQKVEYKNRLDLSEWKNIHQPGDQIIIEVLKASAIKYQGAEEELTSTSTFTWPLQ